MAPFEEINIPQKPPMVMVERLIEMFDKTAVTSLVIREDNVFCENGLFLEPGLIENMAQTAAAGAGAKPGIKPNGAPLGFIGGIRNLKIKELPKVGEEIITSVTVMHEIFDATVVQAEIMLNNRVIASGELKIFLIVN
ncbi:MAG: 3-hydroxyacyl-ACP dehydratase [Bacteroidetes bacterium]|nr:3-hydroxyacyl-ACP dehydratase [Bacteroidota bacterium]